MPQAVNKTVFVNAGRKSKEGYIDYIVRDWDTETAINNLGMLIHEKETEASVVKPYVNMLRTANADFADGVIRAAGEAGVDVLISPVVISGDTFSLDAAFGKSLMDVEVKEEAMNTFRQNNKVIADNIEYAVVASKYRNVDPSFTKEKMDKKILNVYSSPKEVLTMLTSQMKAYTKLASLHNGKTGLHCELKANTDADMGGLINAVSYISNFKFNRADSQGRNYAFSGITLDLSGVKDVSHAQMDSILGSINMGMDLRVLVKDINSSVARAFKQADIPVDVIVNVNDQLPEVDSTSFAHLRLSGGRTGTSEEVVKANVEGILEKLQSAGAVYDVEVLAVDHSANSPVLTSAERIGSILKSISDTMNAMYRPKSMDELFEIRRQVIFGMDIKLIPSFKQEIWDGLKQFSIKDFGSFKADVNRMSSGKLNKYFKDSMKTAKLAGSLGQRVERFCQKGLDARDMQDKKNQAVLVAGTLNSLMARMLVKSRIEAAGQEEFKNLNARVKYGDMMLAAKLDLENAMATLSPADMRNMAKNRESREWRQIVGLISNAGTLNDDSALEVLTKNSGISYAESQYEMVNYVDNKISDRRDRAVVAEYMYKAGQEGMGSLAIAGAINMHELYDERLRKEPVPKQSFKQAVRGTKAIIGAS
jgi:hypothetical protein